MMDFGHMSQCLSLLVIINIQSSQLSNCGEGDEHFICIIKDRGPRFCEVGV